MSRQRAKTSSAFTATLAEIARQTASLNRLAGTQSNVFEQQAALRLSDISRQMGDLLQLTRSCPKYEIGAALF